MEHTHRPDKTNNNLRKLRAYILALTAALLFTTTSTTCAETKFHGTLNSVSITDVAGTNIPPTAQFTYSQDGDIFTFDASGSLDSDGNIVKYKWDFGDESTGAGSVVSHQYTIGTFPVTLTIVDDQAAVSLIQSNINTNKPGEIIGIETQYPAGRNVKTNQFVAYKLPKTPSQNGILKSISFSLAGLGKHVKFALYTHDAKNDLPATVVPDAITVKGVIPSNNTELVTLDIEKGTPQIVAATQYWIILQATDDWVMFGAKWDGSSRIAYKDVIPNSWDAWNGTASASNPYIIGACYFTYK